MESRETFSRQVEYFDCVAQAIREEDFIFVIQAPSKRRYVGNGRIGPIRPVRNPGQILGFPDLGFDLAFSAKPHQLDRALVEEMVFLFHRLSQDMEFRQETSIGERDGIRNPERTGKVDL